MSNEFVEKCFVHGNYFKTMHREGKERYFRHERLTPEISIGRTLDSGEVISVTILIPKESE